MCCSRQLTTGPGRILARPEALVNHGIIFLGCGISREPCSPPASARRRLAGRASESGGWPWPRSPRSRASRPGRGKRVGRRDASCPECLPHVFEPGPRDVRRLARARLVVTVGAGYDAWAARIVATCAARAVVHDAGRSVGVVAEESAETTTGRSAATRTGGCRRTPRRARSRRSPRPSRGSTRRAPPAIAREPGTARPRSPRSTPRSRRSSRAGERAADRRDAQFVGLLRGRLRARERRRDRDRAGARAISARPSAPWTSSTRENVPTIFTEPQFPPSAARVVAADAGVRVVLADPIGGVPGRATYADLLRFDARAFREGLR